MNTKVWVEAGGDLRREALRTEARRLHQIHQPPECPDAWRKMSKRLRRKLFKAMGTFPAPQKLNVRKHGGFAMDGYRIENITYQSREDLRVTANLFVPDGGGRFPAVLNVHGHWFEGKIAPAVAARGHTLAREGFVVLSVDALGAGERGTVDGKFDYHGGQHGAALLSLGETLLGMQLYDNMRGVDLLESLDCVDASRIGVTGASGGGNQTMWLAAMDPRIKASVPVVSVGTFEAYVGNDNCWCETLPDGLTITEEWAILALAAPNPVLVLSALEEKQPAFIVREAMRSCEGARRIYRMMGAESRIVCQAIGLPHGYFPEMRRHMLGWFKRWLRGEGDGWPAEIAEVPELPREDLMCFPNQRRPENVKSLLRYLSERGKKQRNGVFNGAGINRSEKISKLRALLRIPKEHYVPCIEGCVPCGQDGWNTERFSLRPEPDVQLPCLLIFPEKAISGVVIAAHPQGKAQAWVEMDAKGLLLEGKILCLIDLRDTGETQWEQEGLQSRNAMRSAVWLGRTMIGNWVRDLRAIQTIVRRRFPGQPIELLGFRETAVAVLAAGALDAGCARITAAELLGTYVVDNSMPSHAHSIFVPGILNWGDVGLLAALNDCPLDIRSLVHPSGAPFSESESALWEKEVKRLRRIRG